MSFIIRTTLLIMTISKHLSFESRRLTNRKNDDENILNFHSHKNRILNNNMLDYFNDDQKFKENKPVDVFSAKNIKCSKTNCPKTNGYCIFKDTCRCGAGLANLNLTQDGKYCEHKRKYQILAFLIEAVFSFGLGHVYCERYYSAALKCALEATLIIIYLNTKARGVEMKLQDNLGINGVISGMMAALTAILLVWHVYDVVNFSLNNIHDGKGIPLISWNNVDED